MTTLAELIARDDVRATWFWTRSVSTGRYSEMESYDAVFSRNGRPSVTGELERPTLFVRDLRESENNSMRNNGGKKIKPDLHEMLGMLLSDANDADTSPTFSDWFQGQDVTGRTAPELLAEYEQITKIRDDLRAWLGDYYDEYQAADRD